MNGPHAKYGVWEKTAGLLLYLTMLAGALLRVVVWWQNRSLFLDEANLARNFCEMQWAGVFQLLNYQQYAPPLFLVVQKMSVSLLGQQEYALRLFPLLCGLAGIYLFYKIARRILPNSWMCLAAVWIFCCSDFLLRYATEGKQYSSDAALALGLVALSLVQAKRPFRVVWAAVIGAVALWISMPAVFVLFGVGLYFLQKYWSEKDGRSFRAAAAAVSVWLLSFAVYYGFFLRPTLAIAPLVEYHQDWFFPLLPTRAADWLQARDLLLTFPYYTAGYTVLALLVGSAGILTGLVVAIRRHSDLAFLLAVPVFTCLVVSGFGLYSLIPRMLVWAFPLVLLLQALGWQAWWHAAKPWYLRSLLAVLLVSTAGLHRGWTYLIQPFEIEEIRPVLDVVAAEFQPEDLLYVSHEAWPAVAYYQQCHPAQARYQFGGSIVRGDWNEQPSLEKLKVSGKKAGRVWLVYSHVVSEAARQAIQTDLALVNSYARQLKAVERTGARAYLYLVE